MKLKSAIVLLLSLLVLIVIISLTIVIFTISQETMHPIIDSYSICLIGKIKTSISKNMLETYCFDGFKSKIVLIEYHHENQLNHQTYGIRELRPYGSISSHAITEFAFREVPQPVFKAAFKILNGQELKNVLHKDLKYFTPVFVTHFTTISAMVRDINNDDILDIILRAKLNKDEFQDEDICAYEVINGEATYFWAYHLEKFVASLCEMDSVLIRDNGLRVIVFKPLREAFVIKLSNNRYIKSKVSIWELPYLWRMSASSIFSPKKFILGLEL